MEYSKEELNIFKNVIKDYKIIKEDIDKKIQKGCNLQDLYDYIRHLSSCHITNYDLTDNIMKYIDFDYCDMLLSIYDDNDGVYLGDTIEVYNDKRIEFIGNFNNINEIKNILKESE